MTLLAADINVEALAIFGVVLGITLGITYWASKRTKTTTDFYAASRGITGAQNGFAISGDYMSAASFLGIAGLIFLYGFDGFLYSVGFLVAFLTVLFLLVYVVAGGMIATTWVQIIKAALLMTAAVVLSVLVLAEVGFNPIEL